MTEALLSMFSRGSPPILLSMDSNDTDLVVHPTAIGRPPDINLPLSSLDMISPSSWVSTSKLTPCDILDVSLGSQIQDPRALTAASKGGKRLIRRGDSIWGAWFFFQHYFRPAVKDNLGGLNLETFIVQHDMENMYMWVFRDRPENTLGKMQLRSYMNGHARFGEPQFPFSVEKGFTRSHRMQRKQYRGLSNPQCVHGIEIVRNPKLSLLTEEAKKRWFDLTGRDLNFTLPEEAEEFSSWQTFPCTDLDFDRSDICSLSKCSNGSSTKKQKSPKSTDAEFGASTLDLSCKLIGQLGGSSLSSTSFEQKKRKSDLICGNTDEECCAPNGSHSGEILGEETQQGEQPSWLSESSGVILEASGPVTAAKSVYEDDKGYLIMVSLPFTDMARLRVSWLNTTTHGVVKIHGISTGRVPVVMRGDRTFKLTDLNPEHCPQGEYLREISLATRIPENAELKAFYIEQSAGLEILVPKHSHFSEEREVRVFLPPQLGKGDALLL